MRRLALRRFPNEVVRRRQAPGAANFYGEFEFEPGTVIETIYPARVLPLSLEDSDFVGGTSLLERLKVFVPRGIVPVRGEGDALTWAGSVLTWNGAPLRWGGGDGTLVAENSEAFPSRIRGSPSRHAGFCGCRVHHRGVAKLAASGALSRAFASAEVVGGALGARMRFSDVPGASWARSNPVG